MEISIFEESNQVQDQLMRFHLVEGTELFAGLNDVPMLHLPRHDKYIRLSPLGADIITMFDSHQTMTENDIEDALITLYPNKKNEIAQKVPAFLTQLKNAGAITSPDEEGADKEQSGKATGTRSIPYFLFRLFRFLYERPMLRIGIWHPNRILADRLFSKLKEAEVDGFIKLLFAAWFVLAIIIAGFITVRQGMFFNSLLVVWPLVIGIFLLHMVLHELSHVFVGSYFRVKIRAVGFGLLYYVLPFFYMDRTDSYRLKSAKQHMYIALAGPAFDISAATLSAIIMSMTTGWVKASFHVLLLTQTVTFIANINPLLPTDGYRALESALKEINLRRRAFQTLFCVLTRKQLPPQLITQSSKTRSVYFIYGILALVWTAFLVSYVTIWYFTTGIAFISDWLLPVGRNMLRLLGL